MYIKIRPINKAILYGQLHVSHNNPIFQDNLLDIPLFQSSISFSILSLPYAIQHHSAHAPQQSIQFKMRNQKETVLQLLVNPRAGDNFDRKQTEKQLLEAITTKNDEIAILHQVNSRLAYELAQLQRRLGIDPETILRELERLGDEAPPAGRLEYLEPLFLAYDETILKQKKIIAMLYSQLQDFQRRSETLVRENECLLEESKNKCKKILEIYHRGSPEESLTLAYNRLLRETEQERNDLVRQQSEEVLQGYHRLELHAEALQRELQESRQQGERHFKLLKQQGQQLKEALLSVDNLLKVKEFLQKTVNRMGEENIALETLKAEQEAKLAKNETEIKSLRGQLMIQRKLGREDTERIGIELDSLKSESEQAAKRERQLFNRNMLLEKELEGVKDALRVSRRESERDKANLEQTMRMCETYESKVTAAARKQRSLVEILDQSKEKLDGLLLERDKALLKVERLEKALEESGLRQREEHAKVRQNYEKMLGQLHERLRLAQEEREQTESVFMESELSLKNQLQKLTRQNSLLREENLKFIQSIHVNSGSQIIGKLKEYEAKHDSLLKLLAQKERQLKEQQSRYQQQQHDSEAELKNLTRLLEKEKAATTQYLREITQERSRSSIVANEKDCLEAQVKKLKKSIEYRSLQASDDKDQRLQEMEGRLSEALRREKETKARACQMLEKYDAAEVLYRSEYEKQIAQLQGQNEKLRRKIEKLKNRGLE